jgi:2-polyprenyl-3-methyl-5-hydroxy-6-metoxy-1,4-benzoquinol methylase
VRPTEDLDPRRRSPASASDLDAEAMAPDVWAERIADYRGWTCTTTYQQRVEVYCDVARSVLKDAQSPRPLCIDLGCGPGVISFALAELGFEVVGFDSSPAMIGQACALASAAKRGSLSFSVGDVEQFHSEYAHAADLVVCSSVLEFLRNPPGAIETMARYLREGATLAVSVPNRRSIVRRAMAVARAARLPWSSYMRLWTTQVDQNTVLESAQRVGLALVKTSTFGFPRFAPFLEEASRKELFGTLTLMLMRRPSSTPG